MFHPVGSKPPSVYWRRRVLLLAFIVALVVLLALTIGAVSGTDNTPVGAGDASGTSSPSSSSSARPTTRSSASSSASTSSSPKSTSSSPSRSTSPTVAPVACTAADLSVAAMVGKPSYQVGDQPMVELQVTNTSKKPCVQDLADSQVVLKIYNGESRVWGSHDCKTLPGTSPRTLAVGQPVRVTIRWSGFTSSAGCKNRQHVGAGTYTLYAQLSGKTGKATQFSIG